MRESNRLLSRQCVTKLIASVLVVLHLAVFGQVAAQDAARPSLAGFASQNDAVQVSPIRRRWAFLVGIDSYNYLPELHYCSADMRNLRDALIQYGGYDPECVVTATFNNDSKLSLSAGVIRVELMNLLDKVEVDDSILFAFSGHGDIDENGKAWLMAPEAKIGRTKSEMFQFTALPVDEVYRIVQTSKARQKLIVLDACHSGGARGTESVTKLSLDDIKPGKGVLELLSCDAEQVSYESKELQQGVFSHFLAKGIAGAADIAGDRDGLVSADELYDFAHLQTREFVQENWNKTQTPKRRSDAIGKIVVAVRTTRALDMTDAQILAKLESQSRNAKLPAGFAQRATTWLKSDATFPPHNDLKKLLELLARNSISKSEFDRLSRPSVEAIEQHLHSSLQFNSRKMFAVVIGINQYQSERLGDLNYCEADANAFANVVRQGGGELAKVELLIGQETKLAKIRSAIANAFRKANAGDIVLVYFAGHGAMGSRSISVEGTLMNPKGRKTHDKLLAEIKWLASDTIVTEAMTAEDGFTASDLMGKISESKADVVVFSDSSFFDLPLSSNLDIAKGAQAGKAVLFVGLDNATDGQFGSQLQLLLTRALLGAADTGVVQRKPLLRPISEATKKVADSDKAEANLTQATRVRESAPVVSDGFVSLHEIVETLRFYDQRANEYFGCDMKVRGYIPIDDRIISKVNHRRE